MSDQASVAETTANAPENAPQKREKRQVFDVPAISRARLRKRGVTVNPERLHKEGKAVRASLRSHWSELCKAAPKSYGSKGAIKREPNDGRQWGPIPASVAKSVISGRK